MERIKLHLFFTVAIMFVSLTLMAENDNLVTFSNTEQSISVSDKLEIYEDKSNNLSLRDILEVEFKKMSKNVPNMGITQSEQ